MGASPKGRTKGGHDSNEILVIGPRLKCVVISSDRLPKRLLAHLCVVCSVDSLSCPGCDRAFRGWLGWQRIAVLFGGRRLFAHGTCTDQRLSRQRRLGGVGVGGEGSQSQRRSQQTTSGCDPPPSACSQGPASA